MEKFLRDLIEFELKHRTEPKESKTIRVYLSTGKQIRELAEKHGFKEAEVVGIAIDHLVKELGAK